MDGVDSSMRWRSLKERLRLNGMACCGAASGLGPSNMREMDYDEIEEGPMGPPTEPIIGMSLAEALAAEREFRASLDSDEVGAPLGPIESPPRPNNNHEEGPIEAAPSTPMMRVSLMRLLEEADDCDGVEKKDEDRVACDLDTCCCVCMGRKKGAAFIPCGHTFCRVCSRELWLTRRSCPLCNRNIVEILDIF